MIFDNLSKLNRPSRVAVFTVMVVIAVVAMYNRMVAPFTSYLLASQQHETVVLDLAKKNEVIGEVIETKRKELKALRGQFAEFQSTLFTPEKAKEFFSDLQIIVEQSGCVVHSLNLITSKQIPKRRGALSKTTKTETDKTKLKSESDSKDKQLEEASDIVVEKAILSISGLYNNLIKLVERLQRRTQKVWIDQFEVEVLDIETAQLKCDITITIYTIRDKESIVYE